MDEWEWTDITLKCPVGWVPKAYERHAEWLDQLMRDQAETDELRDMRGQAKLFWERLSPHAKNFFTLATIHSPQRFNAEFLADKLQIPHGRSGVAGIFAWPGRHATDLKMSYPWSWHNDGNMTVYWVEEMEADWFRPLAHEWTRSKEWQALGMGTRAEE